MIVTLADGTVHERFVPYLVGFPSHPMSREDVESKALDDAAELVRLVAS